MDIDSSFGGLYKIVNKNSKKIYFGISSKDPNLRFKEHTVRAQKGYEKFKIHQAILKYGIECFEFTIICRSKNWNVLCKLESYYILKYKTQDDDFGYNMTPGGDGTGKGKDSPNYGTKRPENAKRTKYINDVLGNPMKNKEIVEKHFTGKRHPYHKNENTRRVAIANIAKRRLCPVYQIDPKTSNIICEFPTMEMAAKSVGLANSTPIYDMIKGRQKIAGGFAWKRK